MLLTNMLPNQGNGAYTLSVYAMDREGRVVSIGSRTLHLRQRACDAAVRRHRHAGAGRHGVGCELRQLRVGADAPSQVHPERRLDDDRLRRRRVDRATRPTTTSEPTSRRSFPDLNNTNGAIGFRVIDTTALTNGLHTIAWTVTDNLGATEGIGSRYFRVSNGVAAGLTRRSTDAVRDGQQRRRSRPQRPPTQPGARTPRLGSGGALAQLSVEQLRPGQSCGARR